jgi:hypothetical protein
MTVQRLTQTISFKVRNRRRQDYPHSRVETARANGSQRARKAIQLAFVELRLGVISGCAGPPAARRVNLNERTPRTRARSPGDPSPAGRTTTC